MKTVAFDLDDVLCFRDQTLSVEHVIGSEKYEGCTPILKYIYLLNECYDDGYRIVIYTSRGMGQFDGDVARCDKELRKVTTKFLAKHGIKYHELVFGKIHFDLLIDNKVQNSRNIHDISDIRNAIDADSK